MLSKLIKKLFQKENGKTKKTDQELKQSAKEKPKVTANRTGELGEYKIGIQLEQFPKDYKHLNDLLLPNPKAKSGYSQIDHVVITPFGIFVIETKNYKGTIYGAKDRKTWSVNGQFKMMNPFIQNYGHLEAIKALIPSKYHQSFVSMVSFTKRCTFKAGTELRHISSSQLLVYDVELSEFIYRKVNVIKLQNKEPLLKAEEVESIYTSLQDANVTDASIRAKHVDLLKKDASKPKDQCVICKKEVSANVSHFCKTNDRFKGKVYCFTHQKTV